MTGDSDVGLVLAHRHDNGGDYWATPDRRMYVGNPFSTITSLAVLHELGVTAEHEAVSGGLDLIIGAVRDDGRIRVAPKAPLYPCYTAEAVRTACRFGLAEQPEIRRTLQYLLDSTHDTGGWRCSFTRFGKGPETRCGSPGATLYALDALRFLGPAPHAGEPLDQAVELLLDHWDARTPLGPCHHGIGTQFMRVEYPFVRYNLFYYVYVLSFFARAHLDPRFHAALEALEASLTADGRIRVEHPHRGLKGLAFCARGEPSELATRRYREILANLGRS